MNVMDSKRVQSSLMRYFKTLSSTGFASSVDVKRLLMVMFENEMLNSELSFFLSEKDYNIISRAIRKIVGDCLIPYDTYCNNKLRQGLYGEHIGSPMLMDTSLYSTMRHTEDDVRRHAETTEVRMAQGIR